MSSFGQTQNRISSAQKRLRREMKERRYNEIREEYRRSSYRRQLAFSSSYSSSSGPTEEEKKASRRATSSDTRLRITSVPSLRGSTLDVTFNAINNSSEDPENWQKTIRGFQSVVEDRMVHEIIKYLNNSQACIFQVKLSVEVRKYDEVSNRYTTTIAYLSSLNLRVHQREEVRLEVTIAFDQMQDQLDNWNANGSNWTIHRIKVAHLLINRYTPLRGGSYFKLPEWLNNKNAIINIQNKDQLCFKYSMEAGYNLPSKNPQRVTKYQDRNTFRYSDRMSFPFTGHYQMLKDFEKLNEHLNISINAYFCEYTAICVDHFSVIYTTNVIINDDTKIIDLLLVQNKDNLLHWTLIKNFNRLFNYGRKGLTLCRHCLVRMKPYSLAKHMESCRSEEGPPCKVKLPQPLEAFAGFRAYKKLIPAPFVIYADFESIMCEVIGGDNAGKKKRDREEVKEEIKEEIEEIKIEEGKEESKERFMKTHVPNAFCFIRLCNYNSRYNGEPVLYRSDRFKDRLPNSQDQLQTDVGEKFIKRLTEEKEEIFSILKRDLISGHLMRLTEEDEQKFQEAQYCHICKLPFSNGILPCWKEIAIDRVKVRDHDHLNPNPISNYRGAAHAWCNLQFHIDFVLEDRGDAVSTDDEELDSEGEEEENEMSRKKRKLEKERFKMKTKRYQIPVVFHNLKGYDGHIILKAITKKTVSGAIDCIPQNGEKFLTFSFHKLRFMDSLQFLNSSLEGLVENIKKDDPGAFHILQSRLGYLENRFNVMIGEEQLKMLLQKGVYPYDYMDSFERFQETKLPSKESFHSVLTNSDISEEDYNQAQKVWKAFKIQNMGDYHDLYLLTDVLLLCDVFQRFRRDAIADTGLDPLHYFSLPGYSLDSCYRQMKPIYADHNRYGGLTMEPFRVEVFNEGLPHKDMITFVESMVRGGISMITGRLGTANHKGLKEYDSSLEDSYIMYLDANNLYGWAMVQPMPIGDYRWITDIERFTTEYIISLKDDAEVGYLLEVDLDIPIELHDKFRNYPLAPESRSVKEEELSPFILEMKKRLGSRQDSTKKLMCTLENKINYRVHYRNLKLYLKLGYKLMKVHRVLRFRQMRWVESYIMSNTTKRAAATNEFLKDYFKLMNNAVFGKFLQDDRKHRSATIVNSAEKMDKLSSSPYYENRYIVNEDTVITYSRKREILKNKPIIVGASILELSKLHMYDFYYNTMQRIFGIERLRLNFTDTDSLCMWIKTKDFHQELIDANVTHMFDWSNYPTEHKMYDKKGKAVLGLFKDETAGWWIKQFVGLRSKLYSVLKDEKKMSGEIVEVGSHLEKKTAKGVKKHLIKKKLRHQEYYECLTNPEYNPYNHTEEMIGFSTVGNQIYTTRIEKMTLSAADDKMYVCDDGVTCLPYGHYKIAHISSVSH